ncbi:MAG: adenine phosphoribosyltransferase [Endomicrobium sp.]|nr:adenine phosphoribosyltransferase [Endomicrobium sp.]
MDIRDQIKNIIRDVKDFPIKGVVFKDITPLFEDITLFKKLIDIFYDYYKKVKIDKIVGIESRGFIVGMPLAVKMNIPFVPVRKEGKLPFKTVKASYSLEYDVATIEMHEDAISCGENILIVDDILATGGTVNAAIKLVELLNANVVASAFIAELVSLKGRQNVLSCRQVDMFSLVQY